jgi:predicted Zn-dependent protease
LLSLAWLLIQSGRADEAGPSVDAALALEPERSQAHLVSSLALQASGENGRALEAAELAVRLDAELPEGWAVLGDHRVDADDTVGALEAYDRVLGLDPDHEHAAVQRAEILIAEDRDGEAADGLLTYVSRHPEDIDASRVLGRALYYAVRSTAEKGVRLGLGQRTLIVFASVLDITASWCVQARRA